MALVIRRHHDKGFHILNWVHHHTAKILQDASQKISILKAKFVLLCPYVAQTNNIKMFYDVPLNKICPFKPK
jgi:hypothetical protein